MQTAHNLRLLPDLVSNLLDDLNDAVKLRIQRAFDSAAIGREVAGKDGGNSNSNSAIKFTARAKPATEPTSSNQQQWIKILWTRLERVIEDVANCCIKVYTLEKVLKMKRDAVTQVEFLEEVMKTLDEKPSFTFWTTLAKAFEAHTKEAARCRSFFVCTFWLISLQPPHGCNKPSAQAILVCFACSTISLPRSRCIRIRSIRGNTKALRRSSSCDRYRPSSLCISLAQPHG